MENSSSFLALETMMRQGFLWIQFSEFEGILDLLEKKNLISPTEHQALLKLAKQLSIDKLDDSEHSI
jgi:hypothetical protein